MRWQLPLLGALGLLASCGGGGSSSADVTPTGIAASRPDGTRFMIASVHEAGQAADIHVLGVQMGRLVEVFGQQKDTNTGLLVSVPMYSDYVISQSLSTEPFKWELSTNPVTAKESLTILADVSTEDGLALFDELLLETQANLDPVFDSGLGSSAVPSMVPRNAALLVTFDDLIDPDLVNRETVQVYQGVPPEQPFQARVFADMSTGGLVREGGQTRFYPTRLIIDSTISQIESFSSDPPLSVNGVGFPPSNSTNVANIAFRIPTREDASVGQQSLLRNRTGHALAYTSNGTIDNSSSTRDVVRVMRSGGASEVTADDYNGFLPDDTPPELVGAQPIRITNPPVIDAGAGDRQAFILPVVTFDSSFCAQTPVSGDVITQSGIIAEITQLGSAPINGVITDVRVRLLLYPEEWDEFHPLDSDGRPQGFLEWELTGVGSGEFLSIYDPVADSASEACFVRILPTPPFPDAPGTGLQTDSVCGIRFSEPMDPSSLTAFDSMTLTRKEIPTVATDYVVGSVLQSLDLQTYTFTPDLPLAHSNGLAESYYLTIVGGDKAPTDLAGNSMVNEFPGVRLRVSPTAATEINGGRVTRFTQPDEEILNDNEDGDPEWNGQHLFDLNRELIRPRSVIRFNAAADRSQAIPAVMTPIATGVITPLSGLGSKMQTVYRNVDFSYTVDDQTNYNLDVEGMAWSPIGGQVFADHFNEFEIRLSHCNWLPDEVIDPGSLFPLFETSGLKKVFSNNLLDEDTDPQRIVHPKQLGYTVSPGDLYTVPSGTLMMPYPLNRTIPQDEWELFTWRDTRILERSGRNNAGAEIDQWIAQIGSGQKVYSTDQIPTVGLPLLMEFRTYPDAESLGLNSFDISIACNTSSRPYFRAFSTGGTNQQQVDVTVDPDLESEANGGYNPTSTPPGQTTYGLDPVFYIGALDFVVRVSTSHSVWFPVLASGEELVSSEFSPLVVEPVSTDQPAGTSIDFAFRGATSIEGVSIPATYEGSRIDPYGDHYDRPLTPPLGEPHDAQNANKEIAFLDGVKTWADDVSEINGSNYFQVRATFLSNPITAQSPLLSALALSWQEAE